MRKEFAVYIMTNKRNTVFYTGVTGELASRVYQHKTKLVKGFTELYKICKLIYFEIYDDPNQAIAREKQLKGWSRSKKLKLVAKVNPNLRDLSE